tara:strand:+ start:271 stop:522 length:252 start_codon:yes stop_codon:yes gene_type:complete
VFYKNNFVINKAELKTIRRGVYSNTDFRVMLWISSIELIKENLFFGVGAVGSDNRLHEVFAVKRQWLIKMKNITLTINVYKYF